MSFFNKSNSKYKKGKRKTHVQSATNHAVNGIVPAAPDADNLNLGALGCREGAAPHGRETTSRGDARSGSESERGRRRRIRECIVANRSWVGEGKHGHCNTCNGCCFRFDGEELRFRVLEEDEN